MPEGFKTEHPVRPKHFDGEDLSDRPGRGGRINESRFVRCKFCHSINDTEIRPRGDGWAGNITYPDIEDTPTSNAKNPTVGGSGCWFCGSSQGW